MKRMVCLLGFAILGWVSTTAWSQLPPKPQLVEVTFYNQNADPITCTSGGALTVELKFDIAMNQAIAPTVKYDLNGSYSLTVPLNGNWQSGTGTLWQGSFTVTSNVPEHADGIYHFKILGAKSAGEVGVEMDATTQIDENDITLLITRIAILKAESMNFGTVKAGVIRDQQLTVQNQGCQDVSVTGVSVGGAFTVVNQGSFPKALAAGGNLMFTVRFYPTLRKTYNRRLDVFYESKGVKDTLFVMLSGIARGPQLVLSAASIDFGEVKVGVFTKRTVLVSNTIAEPDSAMSDSLFITSIATTDPVYSAQPAALKIAPGDTKSVEITFTPAAGTIYNNRKANFTSNDSTAPGGIRYVTLNGTGIVIPPIQVRGVKFDDKNGNGVRDTGEPGLADWMVILEGAKRDTAITDANGNYLFEGIPPGAYLVREVLKRGWIQTYPEPHGVWTLQLAEGTAQNDVNFGNFKLGEINGLKFHDLNGNGVRNEGDAGVAGWAIHCSPPAELPPIFDYYPVTSDVRLVLPVGSEDTTKVQLNGQVLVRRGTPRVDTETNKLTIETELVSLDLTTTAPIRIHTNPAQRSFGWVEGASSTEQFPANSFFDVFVEIETALGTFDHLAPLTLHAAITALPPTGATYASTNDPFDLLDSNGEVAGRFVSAKFTVNPPASRLPLLTGAQGDYHFFNMPPGKFTITEGQQEGWFQTSVAPQPVAIISGTKAQEVNFGNARFGRIEGVKWNDLNGNGKRNENEPGLVDWEIALGGKAIDTVMTNGEGKYVFQNLAPGTYSVVEILKSNWVQTSSPKQYSVVLNSGAVVDTIHFGNWQLGEIHGTKWDDQDGDGVRDEGEPGLSGWRIRLMSSDTISVLTDDLGNYAFKGLAPKSYKVAEVMQPGWEGTYPTKPDTHTVNLQAGQIVTKIDFGNRRKGGIFGVKWHDLNANGKREANEPGLAGWRIGLADEDTVYATTDAVGYFEFKPAASGQFKVFEVLSGGWQQSYPAGAFFQVSFTLGETIDSLKFGNWKHGRIGGQKWEDLDGDGVKDANEPGLSGWVIRLNGAATKEKTTDAQGRFTFDSLLPGQYTVSENAVNGWKQTYPAGGVHSISLVSNMAMDRADFASVDVSVSSVDEGQGATIPQRFALRQNYPNPFNPATAIEFDVPRASHIKLEVFNLLGGRVAVLVEGNYAAGRHKATFDGGVLSGGVYLYKLTAPDYVEIRKMLLVK